MKILLRSAFFAIVGCMLIVLAGRTAVARPSRARARPRSAPASPAKTPTPSPRLTPEQVVRIQVQALQHNNVPMRDHGISVTFSFASPENQSYTGPLEHFASIVKSPTYRPMLNCRSVAYGEVVSDGDQARLKVRMIGSDGQPHIYIFLLSRQKTGALAGCWLTDGCVTEEPTADTSRQNETLLLDPTGRWLAVGRRSSPARART